ncbi:MAG: AAA family ATPase [Fibrobacteria bacterium]|nr:AAA family ATPase [Fibrobacteria bacterium]
MDLFNPNPDEFKGPLAYRMRPRTLDEFLGQDHILGPGRLLRRSIQADQLSSLIFFGPPGTGKTTLAMIIANTTKSKFHSINAVLAGVKDIREAIKEALAEKRLSGRRYILFIDEVHRFNKAQQDALLPHVENGTLTLIGATTENPYFEVNKALISRSRIFQLYSLNQDSLLELARIALSDKDRGYGSLNVVLDQDALEHLVNVANGDARSVLNALELAVETTEKQDGEIHIRLPDAEESIQQKAVLYDKDGDAHYDTISAFIKSVRGSDPDAALFWMAKMIYAGEDPRFIFRRLIILASEDIGLADPHALDVVMNASRAFDYVGMPEGRYHLAQACLYLSTAAKSNSTMAIFDALRAVEKSEEEEVPNHLKDASRDGEGLGHGQGYLYPHAYRDHWVAQQYLPRFLQGKIFYTPGKCGYEKQIAGSVQERRELQFAALKQQEGFDWQLTPTKQTRPEDFWLRRSMENISEMLGQVREELFAFSSHNSERLTLDLSGDLGFLTWAACVRFANGGVWSCCQTEDSCQQMEHWAEHFAYMVRPVFLHMPWEAWKSDSFTEKGAPFCFDMLTGYNLFSPANQAPVLKALKQLVKHNVGEKCILSLGQIHTGLTQTLSGLLKQITQQSYTTHLSKSLLKKIAASEKEQIDTRTSFNPSNDFFEAIQAFWPFHCKQYQKIFYFERVISRPKILSWFEKKPEAPFRFLESNLTEEELQAIKTFLLQTLPGRPVAWQQGFSFLKSVAESKEDT